LAEFQAEIVLHVVPGDLWNLLELLQYFVMKPHHKVPIDR
jgi:hypothetical protein